jgi:hypothetical protein
VGRGDGREGINKKNFFLKIKISNIYVNFLFEKVSRSLCISFLKTNSYIECVLCIECVHYIASVPLTILIYFKYYWETITIRSQIRHRCIRPFHHI